MFVFEAPGETSVERLHKDLTRAFSIIRRHLTAAEPVIVIVEAEALDGGRGPAEAALAHGLLGLVRALALEGHRDGWRISMLATPRGAPRMERLRWIDHLDDESSSGSVVRLGPSQLGRLSV